MKNCPKCGSPQVEEQTNYAKETGRTWWVCGTFQTRDFHPHHSELCLEREEKNTLNADLKAVMQERDELRAYADKLADGLPEGMLPKDVENLRNANSGLAEDLRKVKLERGEALAALRQTCATNTEIRRQLDEARQEAERYRRKTLSQDAEIAKFEASSNENYWEVSRQRDNMRFALHKIADAVRYGFKHGSKSGEEVK